MIAGRYEGLDERIVTREVDLELSIGDYVLSGGELPALVVIDAVARLLPGALGDERSSIEESFAEGLLEWPQYTRPEVFEGVDVPPVFCCRATMPTCSAGASSSRWRARGCGVRI